MRLSLLFFAALFILNSCSKETRIAKKLDGNWSVKLIRVLDGEGFMYFDSLPNGTFSFNSDLNTISANVVYQYTNLNGFVIKDTISVDKEKYVFNLKVDRFFFDLGSNSIDTRILLLTKKSMELEYFDVDKYWLIRFILVKY